MSAAAVTSGGAAPTTTPLGTIGPVRALALRRMLVAAAALGATLLAHAVASGGLHAVSAAPALWGCMVLVAAVAGPRRRPWRERGFIGGLAILLPAQVVVHLAMGVAPWVFGLYAHGSPPLITPLAAAAHVAFAIILAFVLVKAERLLSGLQSFGRAVRAAILPRPDPRTSPAPAWIRNARVPRQGPLRAAVARGPPVPSV
jgi:hypothetical protein